MLLWEIDVTEEYKASWWRRGESNYADALKTSKLLKTRDSQSAPASEYAVLTHTIHTSVFSPIRTPSLRGGPFDGSPLLRFVR